LTVLSDYVARMVDGGMEIDEAMQIAAELFAAGVASAGVRPSAGALRTRKWREKSRHQASQNVTCDAEVSTSPNVTDRHKASQSVTSDNTPLSISKIDNRKRGERLPADWSPSDADRAFAKTLGWSDGQIDSEAENFRDYWIAKPGAGGCKLDWPATWRKWIRSSKIKPAGSVPIAAHVEPDWESAAKMWASIRRWPRGCGNDPDSPACRAPPEVLRKHGIQPHGASQ
jgi:hypothetical protein